MAQKEKPSMLERLQAIDRRWIFFFIMLSVVIPMAFDLTIDEVATPEVQAIYERIEELPPHSNVLLPFDFGPESEPELQPMADGYVRHLCRRKQKLYFMCLWPTGQAQTLKTVNEVLERGILRLQLWPGLCHAGLQAGRPGRHPGGGDGLSNSLSVGTSRARPSMRSP